VVKNGARRLVDVLDALAWCDEVVVLDTGSTDDTARIAASFPNVSLHFHSGHFDGFGAMHRRMGQLARHDWILSIDSDEVVSDELAREIRGLSLDPQTVYLLPFENYFNGRQITTCGWQAEKHERLFNRTVTDFSEKCVHEKVCSRGLQMKLLRHPVRHYSYESLDDFLRKMQAYTTLFAEQNRGRKSASPARAWAHGGWAFFRSYVLKQGFRQGYEGFVISSYNAQTALWKYLKLHAANRRPA
jgi:glycosyltransferase involved in cell wall biosynthesis